MARLVVRNLDKSIVDALKQRAALHGRSMEAEHRALLEALLLQPNAKSFTEVLSAMPNVGQDEDFERVAVPIEKIMFWPLIGIGIRGSKFHLDLDISCFLELKCFLFRNRKYHWCN